MKISKWIKHCVLAAAAAAASASALADPAFNTYVAWVEPNGTIHLVDYQRGDFKPAWADLSGPIGYFLQGVAVASQDERIRIVLIRDTPILNYCGARAYIGYGTSLQETVSSGRYRGLYYVGC